MRDFVTVELQFSAALGEKGVLVPFWNAWSRALSERKHRCAAEMARSDWVGNLRLAYTHCTGVEVVFGRRLLNQKRLEAG